MKTYYKTDNGVLIKVTEEEVMMNIETEAARIKQEIVSKQEVLNTLNKCLSEKQVLGKTDVKGTI